MALRFGAAAEYPEMAHSISCDASLWIRFTDTGFEVLTAVIMRLYLLRYNTVQPSEIQPMSQRNILPPSSDFLPDLLFNPEDGGYVFF
jgi:hypothetical protein